MKRVVVTGIGLVTPLGRTREDTWRRLMAGETAIIQTDEGLKAPVVNFSKNGAGSRMGEFSLLAAGEALNQAGLTPDDLQRFTIGCAVSQSKPIVGESLIGEHPLDPYLIFSHFTGHSANTLIQKKWNLTGPSANVVAACATGVASLNQGAYWVASGVCDMALAGASESSLTPFYEAGFRQMGVLSQEESSAKVSSFDLNRSGFVMGEGAGVFLLESEESAHKRGARVLCVLKRSLLRHSAWDPIRFDPSGLAVSGLLADLLKDTEFPIYINAHGTGTELNDRVESDGILLAVGDRQEQVAVSSTKAATGHLLGAAGAVEAAFAALALERQAVPPTLHLEDPISSLDYVPHVARQAVLKSSCSLSYGFGGQMGGVLFERGA